MTGFKGRAIQFLAVLVSSISLVLIGLLPVSASALPYGSSDDGILLTVRDLNTGAVVLSSEVGDSKGVLLMSNGYSLGYDINEKSVIESFEEGVATLDVDFQILLPGNSGLSPRDSNSASVNRADVNANLTAYYNVGSIEGHRALLITRVSGSWVPELSSILIQEREVHANQGPLFTGNNMHKYPVSNSYSYYTGFTTYWESHSQDGYTHEVTSYCVAVVPGMGSGYEINVRIPIS